MQAVIHKLPQYDYVFYGDTKNLPYGDRTEAEIYKLTKEAIRELFRRDCLLVIIACNTASAETLRKIQDTFLIEEYPERKILGVIIPAVEELIDQKAKETILLATKRTIDSNKYQIELSKRSILHTKLHGVATPELVPLIEAGKLNEAVALAKQTISERLVGVGEVDTVVLGCTHYTKLKNGLREAYGDKLRLISQDEVIPKKLKLYLEKHVEIEKKLSHGGTNTIVLSKQREEYEHLAAELLSGST